MKKSPLPNQRGLINSQQNKKRGRVSEPNAISVHARLQWNGALKWDQRRLGLANPNPNPNPSPHAHPNPNQVPLNGTSGG